MRTFAISSALALLLIAGTAAAADMPMTMNPGGPMHPVPSTMHGPADWHGSSTPAMWHGSTTPGMWHGSTTPGMNGTSTRPFPEMGGFPGTVLSVGSNSFTMDSPRLDNHHVGTTTLTVNVTASTTYGFASSTASFSNISTGEHVIVFGKVSTSTETIAAAHVIVQGAPPKAKGVAGILQRILQIFGVHPPMGGHASSTSAAAVESGGLGGILHTLFGWL